MKKIKIIIIVVIVLLAVVLSAIFVYRRCISNNKSDNSILNELTLLDEEQVQSVEVDGVRIDLKACIFDPETGIGRVLVMIKPMDGDATDDIQTSDGFDNYNYRGHGYSISCNGAGGSGALTEIHDGAIYKLIDFIGYNDKDEDIFLGIFKDGDFNHELAKFEMREEYSSEEVLYLGKSSEIILSSVGVRFVERNGHISNITLVRENGTEDVVDIPSTCVDNGTWAEFGKSVDISDVVAIKDGKSEYELVKTVRRKAN